MKKSIEKLLDDFNGLWPKDAEGRLVPVAEFTETGMIREVSAEGLMACLDSREQIEMSKIELKLAYGVLTLYRNWKKLSAKMQSGSYVPTSERYETMMARYLLQIVQDNMDGVTQSQDLDKYDLIELMEALERNEGRAVEAVNFFSQFGFAAVDFEAMSERIKMVEGDALNVAALDKAYLSFADSLDLDVKELRIANDEVARRIAIKADQYAERGSSVHTDYSVFVIRHLLEQGWGPISVNDLMVALWEHESARGVEDFDEVTFRNVVGVIHQYLCLADGTWKADWLPQLPQLSRTPDTRGFTDSGHYTRLLGSMIK